MEPCLRSLLNTTVTVRSVVGYSESGSETLGDARAVKAYVERKTEIYKHPSGGDERRTKTVLITEEEISIDDRIWLSGMDTSSEVFSKRPAEVISFRHPVTGEIDHYEVEI